MVASGWCVYGYKFKRRFDDVGRLMSVEMVVSEPEAQVVRQIFEWCAVDNLSICEITKRLCRDRVPTPRGNSTIWRRSSVGCILRNETYTGVWHYGKNDIKLIDDIGGAKRIVKLRDKSAWIPVQVPAIILPEIFKAAGLELARRREKGFKPTKHQYLLRGRIRCARCNAYMVGANLYYRCRKACAEFQTDRCIARALRSEKAATLVWEKIKKLLKDDRILFEGIEAEREEVERARRMIQATIAGLQSDNRKTQTKIDRWLDLYGDGLIRKEEYLAKRQAAEGEIERRQAEIAEWQAKLADYRVLDLKQQAEIEAYRAEIAEGIDNATFEDKVKYLDWLKVQCIYDDRTDDLTMTGLLGEYTLSPKSQYYGQLSSIPFKFTVNLGAFFARAEIAAEVTR